LEHKPVMIAVVIERGAAMFRIGRNSFSVTAEECRALAEALAMTGALGTIIENAGEWTLGARWKLELGGPYQRPRDDRRNRVVLHCDGRKWHLLPAEAENLAAAFAAAVVRLP
jgi:hypothetical protein